jgi:MerR family transcriptional regulator/heat shock protein HspR
MPNHYYTEPIYTPGVAAKKLGISTHTLRLYEAEGLIIPFRTDTGRRLYSDLDLEKVKNIREMIQVHGHNFEGIRRLIALAPCWKIRGCDKELWLKCSNNETRKRPCWASTSKCHNPEVPCRECQVYQKIITLDDINDFINM